MAFKIILFSHPLISMYPDAYKYKKQQYRMYTMFLLDRKCLDVVISSKKKIARAIDLYESRQMFVALHDLTLLYCSPWHCWLLTTCQINGAVVMRAVVSHRAVDSQEYNWESFAIIPLWVYLFEWCLYWKRTDGWLNVSISMLWLFSGAYWLKPRSLATGSV